MVNYVITGGPGTGKTSVVEELERLGYEVIGEAARIIAETDERFVGKAIYEIDWDAFHEAIIDWQKEEFGKIGDRVVFIDRGLGDNLAYDKIHKVETSKEKLDFTNSFKHDKIFVLDFLDFYETDELRTETKEEQEELHVAIIEAYEGLGYEIITVPFMSVAERVQFILDKVGL